MNQDHHTVRVGKTALGHAHPLVIIAGPCVIEDEDKALAAGDFLASVAERTGVSILYKSSFDKANRSSHESFRGPGLEAGLAILDRVRTRTGLSVVTDVHESAQVPDVAAVVDLVQTPAFLCRQTDFIQAVARAGKPVMIKKGQFMAPHDMARVVDKAVETGNRQLLLCERGVSFGYHNLVVDLRSLPIMAQTGYPVVFDATHSVQLPGGSGRVSGGERQFVAPLARAAVAVGVAGIFLETHSEPDRAPCDGPNMVPFAELEGLIRLLRDLDRLVRPGRS